MSLQDEHLKQALQSAPDRDLAPSDAVRQKVLGYAKSASSKHEGWFKKLLNRFHAWQINSWQLVGMSTIASVFLVMVMVRPELPSDTVWVDVSEQEIAQVDKVEAEAEAANSAPGITLALPNEEEIFSPKVTDDLDAKFEEAQSVESTVLLHKEEKKEVRVKSRDKKIDSGQVSESVIVLSDNEAALAAAPAPAPAPVAIAQVESDVAEDGLAANKAVVRTQKRKMESNRGASKSNLTAREVVSLSNDTLTGVTLAKKDIQAGNYRLLFVGGAWPKGKALVDEETGLRIELFTNTPLAEAEVEAYNQTMRDWYKANQDLTD